jgi:hypothetical protein
MTALNKQALREKFEAWAEEAGALPWGHLKKQRTASGNYSVQIYTYMWHAWNACHEVFLDELEAEEKRIAEHNFENQLLANADRDIKALRQRIAELEARTVTLPTPYPKGYGLVSDKYNFALEECADAIRAAGICVKGE